MINYAPMNPAQTCVLERRQGDVVPRTAETAHRLIMPSDTPYTMTLFTTGPHRRDWGFWLNGQFMPHDQVIENRSDGTSVYKGPMG